MAIARRVRRRLQLTRVVRSGAVGLIAGAAAAVGVQIAAIVGWLGVEAAWQIGGLAVNVALLAGLGLGYVQRVSLIEAAAFVDARRKLQERFVTAAELILAGRDQTPAGEICIAQTLSALGDRPLAGADTFGRTRRPLAGAAMMVVLLMTGAVLAWDIGAGPIEKLSTDERMALADVFDESSSAVGADELSDALARAAVVIRRVDDDELAEVLADLRRQGFRPVELTPEAVRAANALMAATSPDAGGTSAGAGEPDAGSEEGMGPWVRVYDPAYRPDGVAQAEGNAPAASGDYEESWQAAQLRAAAAIDRGAIPFAYRNLIRRYFAD